MGEPISSVKCATQHIIGHSGDKSFQPDNSAGTDSQTQHTTDDSLVAMKKQATRVEEALGLAVPIISEHTALLHSVAL